MKKLFFILLATASFVACKKDNGPNPGGSVDNSDRIKSHTSDYGTTTHSYDASGRITRESYSGGGKTEYEYVNGQVLEKKFNTSGTLVATYTYELDAAGLVAKETRSNIASFSETRIYNNDKQVVKYVTNNGGSVSSGDFYFSNGNCDSVRYNTNGSWNYSSKYTYYTDKANKLDYDQYGQFFWGHQSKNLLKTATNVFPDGTVKLTGETEYEFDAKGRVIKSIDKNGVDQFVVYYKYE